MPKKITYLLGAGASAYSIPMMRALPKSMKYFFRKLCHFLKEDEEFNEDIDSCKATYDRLLDEIEQFGTPDIVAKALTLRDDPNHEIWRLKNLLTCFMIAEQFKPDLVHGIDSFLNEEDLKELKKDIFEDDEDLTRHIFSETLDNRYIEFFSSVLQGKRGSLYLPHDINIISWNYDHQIEKALSVFSQEGQVKLQFNFGVFPRTDKSYYHESVNGLKPTMGRYRIIKLNGTAGIANDKNPDNSTFDFIYHSLDKTALRMMGKRLFTSRQMSGELNHLTFAWDESVASVVARETAAELISESDVLVVIGYSFPTFNRLIDRQLFKNFQGNKVYVQDPSADELILKLDGVKADLKEKVAVKSKGEFIIPNEYWEN
ncbi:MAG: hypothetical protein WBG42_17855 [Cryomorphaceae bacterium]